MTYAPASSAPAIRMWAGEILTHRMARAKPRGKKSPPRKLPLLVRTITLTQADQEMLDRLSTDLTDYTGRSISGSAVVRALIRYAGQQPDRWGFTVLSPLVERELSAGVMWGKKR
jgi:hypothetical protein